MFPYVYWGLLIVTNSIIIILWIISIQQFCITNIDDIKRCKIASLIAMNILIDIPIDLLIYLSMIYPNFTFNGVSLAELYVNLEAIG